MERRTMDVWQAARELVSDLRALGWVETPGGLLAAVRARVGASDLYFAVDSPLGPVYIAYSLVGIAAVMRATTPEDFAAAYQARTGRRVAPTTEPAVALERAVARRLEGERTGAGAGELRFDLRELSEFERAVLLKALEIPRGEVRPYGWIAREIGRPKAVRAVGTALAHNPVPLLIPCHRVIKSDGHLGRYSMGGDEAKRTILRAEGVDPDAVESLARAGVRYWGSDTTHIFCFPTCRHARRVSAAHTMRFHSEAEATAAGYRPCKVCRPGHISEAS